VYDLTSSGGGCGGGGGGGGGGGITSEPRNLTVSKKLTSERNLAWKAPKNLNGGSITDYVIQYRVQRTTLWSTFTDGISTNLRVKVTGLTKNVKYQFQVSARTSGGDSPFSKAT
jgi:chitodextrinase